MDEREPGNSHAATTTTNVLKLSTAAGLAAVALLAATGCTRMKSAWSALTTGNGKTSASAAPAGATPEDDTDAQANPAPVAQGEEGAASANASATVPEPEIFPPAPLEPLKVPVINMFGELDGQKPRLDPAAADAGFQQHTFADEGYDADVAIDPTGRWIAFGSTRHTERAEIYLQRVDGTSVTQLTSDPSENAQPAFSPDGKAIAFCSTRNGSWDLYTMDLDGRNVTQVTSGPAQDMHPSFSPDGTRLAYSSISTRSGQWELWTVDLNTREKKMIGYGLFPCWSPDRSTDRIAFQRARQRGSRWFSLWTLDLVGGEARRITEVAVSSNAAIITPSWSPDGKRLAFSTVVDPAQTVKGKPRGQQDVWVIDWDGGNRHRLTDGTSTCLSPCWAADNRVYFVSDRGGHENVWSVRTDAQGAWPVAGVVKKDPAPAAAAAPAPKTPAPKTEVGSTTPEP
jgi:Tol biopolymer transport system component